MEEQLIQAIRLSKFLVWIMDKDNVSKLGTKEIPDLERLFQAYLTQENHHEDIV